MVIVLIISDIHRDLKKNDYFAICLSKEISLIKALSQTAHLSQKDETRLAKMALRKPEQKIVKKHTLFDER